jgi:copper chaperone
MNSRANENVLAFEVPDMSCGHCLGSIRNALASADSQATIQVDLALKRVNVIGSALASSALEAVIRQAGFTPRLLS